MVKSCVRYLSTQSSVIKLPRVFTSRSSVLFVILGCTPNRELSGVFPTRFFHEYTVAVFRHSRRGHQISLWMAVSHHVVAGIWTPDLWKSSWVLSPTEPSHQPLLTLSFLFFLKIYLYIICKYTVAVFRHTRRGCQISLRMVVSHHVVAGIWTPDLWKSSRVLLPTEPSHQPPIVSVF